MDRAADKLQAHRPGNSFEGRRRRPMRDAQTLVYAHTPLDGSQSERAVASAIERESEREREGERTVLRSVRVFRMKWENDCSKFFYYIIHNFTPCVHYDSIIPSGVITDDR